MKQKKRDSFYNFFQGFPRYYTFIFHANYVSITEV